MTQRINLTDQVFGNLTVLSIGEGKYGRSSWICMCACGKNTEVTTSDLRRGNTVSCGCLNRERLGRSTTTHGMTNTVEYKAWCKMKERCYIKTDISYSNYGGRGIKVCELWLDSFTNFIRSMGPRPGPGYSIERRDNDKDYSPENCYWATKLEQVRNRRNSIKVTLDGNVVPLMEASQRLGVSYRQAYRLLKKGKL